MPSPKQGHPGDMVAQVLVVLAWRTERAWLVAVSGRKPAPQVAVAAVAEAAKSAVRVPVVWIALLEKVVDEVVDEVVEEEVVDEVFLVEHKEGNNEHRNSIADKGKNKYPMKSHQVAFRMECFTAREMRERQKSSIDVKSADT
ncbi:hypothetical protein BCON_0005g01080 [Botryotinia convoluta]|uniref:Uncharacterized protein n=1 Tax=Botryotinia convoluta TaxID=54673 RepID=A0A4Z1ITX0_9HELO|nr:hypothetical protein BCON_0005g01080 [Botryotinia convoluta]